MQNERRSLIRNAGLVGVLAVALAASGCRTLVLLAVGEDVSCGALPTRYFPDADFHADENMAGDWLAAMDAPRMGRTWWTGRKTFRVTILPHDYAPIAIAVEEDRNGAIGTIRRAEGAGGWCPGEPETSFYETRYASPTFTLDADRWGRLQRLIDETDFWNRPRNVELSRDGVFRLHWTQSVFEGAERWRDHYVARGQEDLDETEAALPEICALLVDAARVEPVGPYRTCGLQMRDGPNAGGAAAGP